MTQDVYVNRNDVVTLVSISEGVVAVVGSMSDEDEPVLERLLRAQELFGSSVMTEAGSAAHEGPVTD